MKKYKVYAGEELVAQYDYRHFGGRGGQFVFRKDCQALEHALSSSPGLVLDIPCGTGVYSQIINEMGGRVVAADASRLMLEKTAQREKGIPRVLCDVNRLPFGEGTFDKVATIRLFQHFPVGDVTRCLLELNRVTRSDGLVIFDTFRWTPRRMRFFKHFFKGEMYVYSHRVVERMIKKAGLRKVKEVSLYLFSPIMYRKLPAWFLRVLDVVEMMIPQRWLLRTFWACTRS